MTSLVDEMETTVEELLEKPFSNRTLAGKMMIVSKGRPRPLLKMSAVTVSEDGVLKIESFDPAMYDQVPWLTGSESEQCLYCWPCLLFTQKIGIITFSSEGILQHDKTVEHIEAALDFRTFLSEHFKARKTVVDDVQFNEMVYWNREVMKILIHAVCIVVARYQLPRGKRSGQNQLKPESCVNTLNLLRHYNTRYLNHVNDAIEMIKLSPELLNDVVDSIRKVMTVTIVKELHMSAYVTLILSEHSMYRTKTQISVILRYIKKGQVCERFLGFVNILIDKSADVIYNLISSTIEELGIPNKFVSYSLDGGVLGLSDLPDLISMLQKKYPQAYFIPCYFHDIWYILQQSLSVCKELGQFFKMIRAMEAFFHKNKIDFRTIIRNKQYSQFRSIKSYTNFSFIEVLCVINNFVETLESIIKSCTNWNADDSTKAFSFLQFLENFETGFLSRALVDLFELVSPLDAEQKNISPEMIFQSRISVRIINKLRGKEDNFENHFNSIAEEMNNRVKSKTKRSKVDYSNLQVPYSALYFNIIEHLIIEVRSRFQHLNKLEFCSLIQEHAANNSIQESLDKHYLKLLAASGLDLDLEQLRNEVKVQRANGTVFKHRNAYDLLNFFEQSNLKSTFVNIRKLVEFTLTIPFMPPVHNGDASKFKKIKQFSYFTNSQLAPGDVSVLHVESKLLQELERNMIFCDEVLGQFSEMNKSIELETRRR